MPTILLCRLYWSDKAQQGFSLIYQTYFSISQLDPEVVIYFRYIKTIQKFFKTLNIRESDLSGI